MSRQISNLNLCEGGESLPFGKKQKRIKICLFEKKKNLKISLKPRSEFAKVLRGPSLGVIFGDDQNPCVKPALIPVFVTHHVQFLDGNMLCDAISWSPLWNSIDLMVVLCLLLLSLSVEKPMALEKMYFEC